MSVLIRGMDMPENCETCAYQTKGACFASGVNKGTITIRRIDKDRPDWCPLVALPEKHGRLIDGDVLLDVMSKYNDNEGAKMPFGYDDTSIHIDSACFVIENAPTIIEAEGEE